MSERHTVLCVDDDPNLLGLLDAVLEQDYNVETAQGGSAALDLLHGDTPPQVDLVVLDIMMPGMAGWDVLQKIREEPRTRHLPVIMLTGKIDEDSKRRSYELGANMFLTKPYDPETLAASIAVMLSLDAEERSARALTERTNL